ncbi:MAG: hypothetical protein IKF44_00625 [Mycoplasmataceae bacterium]|nr:hypothetical protein [Mycoplasmataceae bacterium]
MSKFLEVLIKFFIINLSLILLLKNLLLNSFEITRIFGFTFLIIVKILESNSSISKAKLILDN